MCAGTPTGAAPLPPGPAELLSLLCLGYRGGQEAAGGQVSQVSVYKFKKDSTSQIISVKNV